MTRWLLPAGPGIRVDAAIEAGERVPPEYDPLIAKLIVHGPDRPAAIARLRRALDEIEIGGIQTTLPFDRFAVGHATFAAGELSTSWVEDHWEPLTDRARAREVAILAAGLAELAGGPGSAGLAGAPGSAGMEAADGGAGTGAGGRAAGGIDERSLDRARRDGRSAWRLAGRPAAPGWRS